MWTIKDLYEWALENGIDDAFLTIKDYDGAPIYVTEVYKSSDEIVDLS